MTTQKKIDPNEKLRDAIAALGELSAMPYYSWPLNDGQVASLFKRYSKAVAIADAALANLTSTTAYPCATGVLRRV